MTDVERALAVLIHDVRTPLGVAHGYLRLVRGDKLPTPADRDRALAGTQEALAKISRLCQDAGAFLEDPPGPGSGRAPASQLAGRVVALLGERGVTAAEPAAAAGTVAVGTSVDRAAEAVATLLAARAAKAPGAAIAIAADTAGLTFTVATPAGPADAAGAGSSGAEDRPFDPWSTSQGLGVIVAHRLITALGGSVRTGHGLALALTMPLETGNA